MLEAKLAVAIALWWTPARLVAVCSHLEVVGVAATTAVDELLAQSLLAVEEPARKVPVTRTTVRRQLAQRRKSRFCI